MAGALKSSSRLLQAAALAGAAAVAYGQALAQAPAALADPTRPPAAFAALPAAASAPGPVSGLQAVIMRPGRKPLAVINGSTVLLGGKLGDATLVHLSESEAVLLGPAGREVLRLTPGVEVAPAKGGGASSNKKRRSMHESGL